MGKLALQHIQITNPDLRFELPEHLFKGGSLEDSDTDEGTEDKDKNVVTSGEESD